MKFVIDMNLSPKWVQVFQNEGWESWHWSNLGTTNARGPSVIQVRTPNVNPDYLAPIVIPVIHQYHAELEAGALVVVSEWQARIRILPLP